MSVIFKVKNHLYESLDPNDQINWVSTTRFIEKFKNKFDPIAQSEKSSRNRKSKWFGIAPEKIREIWEAETQRSVDTGSFYHEQRESDTLSHDTIDRCGVAIPIVKPIYNGDVKYAPEQRLVEGIYPEHFMYLKSAGICGQADRVEVVKSTVDIIDYKTGKEIRMEGFKKWDGTVDKMMFPLQHLDDCNFNHYSLQLSLYMHMILKHNPGLKPGKLVLHHVIFEKERDDEYGYPVLKRTPQGDYIVKTIIPFEVPFLKAEVRNIINHYIESKKK